MRVYLFEIWQHILPPPARITQVPPCIVVRSCTAVKEHAVDHATAADDGSRRHTERGVVQTSLGRAPQTEPVGGARKVQQAWDQHTGLVPVERSVFKDEYGY